MFRFARCLVWSIPLWLALALPPVAAEDRFRFQTLDRVVAIGDVHGALDELSAILKESGLVDESLAWKGGGAHLVSVGDLLHRGDYGRQVMDLLMRLESEAAAAGGAVHVLLGNHEVMALTGDFRYVSVGDYAQFGNTPSGSYPAGFVERRQAFSPQGVYGSWLLDKPALIVVNDTLFLHGGLSDKLDGMSLDAINEAVRRDVGRFARGWSALLEAGMLDEGDDFDVIRVRAGELIEKEPANLEARYAASDIVEALKGLPFDPDGPLWYRGTSLCHPFSETRIAAGVLERLGAARVVVGHTPTPDGRISSRMQGRVYRIDTGMNAQAYQGRPSALVIEGGEIRSVYAGEGRAPVAAERNRPWNRPYGLSDEEIEHFLLTAEIVEVAEVGIGVTRPRRVTLEKDGRRMRALFKTEDSEHTAPRSHRSRRAGFADRYRFEIAAYKLDRLLGLDMVPATVEREIGNQPGSLQYWIENSFNELKRREDSIPFDGHCPLQPQYDLMNAFDILVYNIDRNLSDILYDRDWTLWLVDHSRAFGTQVGVPDMIRGRARIVVTPELAEALERVTRDNLRILEPYLDRQQIRALVTRAAWLRRQS